MGRCTQRQADKLAEFGYDTDGMDYEDAKDLLDQIADNGWQPLPDGPPMPRESQQRRSSGQPRGNNQRQSQGQRRSSGGQSRTATQSRTSGQQRGNGQPRRNGNGGGNRRGKPTARMLEVLADNGYDAATWTFDEAKEKIAALAENNWEPLPEDEPQDDFGGQPEVDEGDCPFGGN